MTKSVSRMRGDAISALLVWLMRVLPGSEAAADIEHAINLTLSSRRQALTSAQLKHNAVRDARRIRLRREASRSVPAEFDEDTTATHAPSPEEELCAAQLEALIRARLKRLPPEATSCFEMMLDGADTTQIAELLKLPPDRIKYIRKQIRAITRRLLRSN